MAIKLSDKPNVQPPDGSYNYGKIKDNTGSNDGTPVNTLVYSDLHLFFEKLMEAGGVTHNGFYDSDDDGYQLYSAFQKAARRELKSLLGILSETFIGDETSPIAVIPPYSLLGIKWNVGMTILSAGYIFYNEELFFCGGFTGTIVDTAVFTKTADNILVVTDAASGSGDFDYADLLFYQSTTVSNPNKVITKVIDIGDWDMNATAGVNINHGISDSTKILSVAVSIISDNSGVVSDLAKPIDNVTAVGGGYFASATQILLTRVAGGYYDQVAYDSTSFNRGYVTIQYIE